MQVLHNHSPHSTQNPTALALSSQLVHTCKGKKGQLSSLSWKALTYTGKQTAQEFWQAEKHRTCSDFSSELLGVSDVSFTK